MSAGSPIVFPIVTVQNNFASLISDVRSGLVPTDSFWVSCYKQGETSVHGRVKAELDEVDVGRDKVNLEGEGGVRMMEARSSTGTLNYTAECPQLGIHSRTLCLPTHEYADPEKANPRRPSRITTFDISPDKSQVATGFLDGTVNIYTLSSAIPPASPDDITTISPYASSKPHLSTVTSVQFLPSSHVVLSAGGDFTLNILPADPPSTLTSTSPNRLVPVRTLRAHTRSITDTAIIARGRNILSSSLDGTLKLWDVGGGEVIRSLGRGTVPIVGMSLGEKSNVDQGVNGVVVNGQGEAAVDEREVETQGKLVVCALQDGCIELFDLSTKQSIHRSTPLPSTTLSSIAYSPTSNLIATGSFKGVVTVYDTRSLGTSLTSFSRNGAATEHLAFVNLPSHNSGLAIATDDGLPYIAALSPDGPFVYKELVGIDCDGIRCVRERDGEVWLAGDDAVVRRYRI